MSRDIRRLLAVSRRLDTPAQSATLAMALNTRRGKKKGKKENKKEKEESWTRRSEENRGSVGEVAGGGIRGTLRKGGENEEDLEEQEKVEEE